MEDVEECGGDSVDLGPRTSNLSLMELLTEVVEAESPYQSCTLSPEWATLKFKVQV